jgi:hypothetical protein
MALVEQQSVEALKRRMACCDTLRRSPPGVGAESCGSFFSDGVD